MISETPRPDTASKGAHALQPIITGISAPRGIFVSLLTGEIWVTDTGNTSTPRCLRYPSFEQYFVTGTYNASIPAYAATLAVIQDQYGDSWWPMPPTALNSITRAWLGRTRQLRLPVARAGSARHHLPARRHIQHEYGQTPTNSPTQCPTQRFWPTRRCCSMASPRPCFWFRRDRSTSWSP